MANPAQPDTAGSPSDAAQTDTNKPTAPPPGEAPKPDTNASPPDKPKKPKVMGPTGFALILVFLALLGYTGYVIKNNPDIARRLLVFRRNQEATQTSRAIPSPTPTPTPIQLHAGKGVYAVSQAEHQGPIISQVVFDPLDIQKGQTLTITAKVVPSSTDSVTGTLQTDSATQTFTFEKRVTIGEETTWQATVTPSSTLWYTYIITIDAKSPEGETNVIIAPRS